MELPPLTSVSIPVLISVWVIFGIYVLCCSDGKSHVLVLDLWFCSYLGIRWSHGLSVKDVKNYSSLFSLVAVLGGKKINILCLGISLKISLRKETRAYGIYVPVGLLGLVLIICCSTMGPNARSVLFYGTYAVS